MSINFQEILKELEYRVEHGIIDLTKEEQVTKLTQILKENGVSNANEMAQKARVYYSYLNEAIKKQPLDKVLKQSFKNPDTGREVTVASALGYEKNKKAYGIAKGMMTTAGYSSKDIDMVDAGPDDDEKPVKPKSNVFGKDKGGNVFEPKEKSKSKGNIKDRIDLKKLAEKDIKKHVEERNTQAQNEFDNSKNPEKYATDFIKMRSDEINDNYLRPAGTEGSSLAENNGGKYINLLFNKGGKSTPKDEEKILNEIVNTSIAKTMPTNDRKEWAKVALQTAKTEVETLLTEKKYKASPKQNPPYPMGVMMDKQSKSMLVKIFERRLKEDPKNKKHYEKQLNHINNLKETDTGVLYETTDGTIGFKHTSNKKTYADPHNNTSVDEKIIAMEKTLGSKFSDSLRKSFAQTSEMVKRASEGLEASCIDFVNERKKLPPKAEKAQIKILTKILTNYPLKQGKYKNYLDDFMGGTPPPKWVSETAAELKIKLPASDEDIVRITIAAAAKTEKPYPPTKAVICVKKISEMVEKINENNFDATIKKYGIKKEEMELVQKTTTSIKDAASGRRQVMAEAHTQMVNAIQKEDKKLDSNSYPKNPDGENGPNQQAYIKDYLHRMHFDAYISGERDGVSSQNIGGDNVEPEYYRNCLAELSGFDIKKLNTPNGSTQLITHLTKRLRIYPDSDSIAFGNKKSSVQIGKETYRTKGESKSILGALGNDMQKCLKGKAASKKMKK